MNIGERIFEEAKKNAVLAMPITQQNAIFIPMVRLSDLKWLETLRLEVTGGSGQQPVEIDFAIDPKRQV